MDNDQAKGITAEEKIAEMKSEATDLAERSKTVDSRLDAFFSSNKAETGNQPEPMPSSNQTQTEEVKPQTETQTVSQSEDQSKQPDSISEDEALANSKNPERTREFIDSQKEEIQKLKEELRKAAGNSVFDSLRQPEVQAQPQIDLSNQFGNLSAQQQQQIADNFIAPDGTVDIDGLNKALKNANSRAELAEIESSRTRQRVQEFEEKMQVREAHSEFPELDPHNEKFDKNFYDLTTIRLAQSGMKLSLTDAAREVRKTYTPVQPVNLDKVRDEAIAQYKESLQKRDQGPLSSGQGEPRAEHTPQQLRDLTRAKGDITQNAALDERLRRAGIIK